MTLISSAEAAIETRVLDILAQAGSFAESVLASPRTIHAFGIRQKLVARYEAFLDDVHQLGKKKNALWGLLFSTEYCIIYAGEGLAFWQGVRMIANNEVDSLGTVFTYSTLLIYSTTADLM
jgi:ATP-binding cassette, subfamily B (MDR/TAP), member 1